jgi:hypothetical protein
VQLKVEERRAQKSLELTLECQLSRVLERGIEPLEQLTPAQLEQSLDELLTILEVVRTAFPRRCPPHWR